MKTSMYDKYGGVEIISKVVHSLYEKIALSTILSPYFKEVDMARLMNHQILFFSSIMGGPVVYDGSQLSKIHHRLHISDVAFYELANLFEEVLEDFNFSAEDITILLNIVTQAKPQIVSP